jgi:hypothetical protein
MSLTTGRPGSLSQSAGPQYQSHFDSNLVRRAESTARPDWRQALAATVILSNVARHGGPGSSLVRWACLVKDRYQQQRALWAEVSS